MTAYKFRADSLKKLDDSLSVAGYMVTSILHVSTRCTRRKRMLCKGFRLRGYIGYRFQTIEMVLDNLLYRAIEYAFFSRVIYLFILYVSNVSNNKKKRRLAAFRAGYIIKFDVPSMYPEGQSVSS